MAELKKEQQIKTLVDQFDSFLIALPFHPNTDAIASGLGLASTLEKMDKKVRVVSHRFELPSNHSFLPKSDEIHSSLTTLNKFIISVSLEHASVEELSYAIENNVLQIYLTPKSGRFQQHDVATSDSHYSYECIITLDSPDLESLGALYHDNAEFFYSVPIVNIDHNPQNEHFGQINLVNINATSTSELVFELVEAWDGEHMDEYIATNLLTGMISKTKSFQAGTVTPRSLAIASHLIDQGARRDEIVKHLYQSKSVNVLKLWGKVLSRLETHEEFPIVWSSVNIHDFIETGTKPSDLADVIDELIINTPDAKNVCIFFPVYADSENTAPNKDDAHAEHARAGAVVSTAPFIHAKTLFEDLDVHGTDQFVTIPSTPHSSSDLQELVIERIAGEYKKTQRQ